MPYQSLIDPMSYNVASTQRVQTAASPLLAEAAFASDESAVIDTVQFASPDRHFWPRPLSVWNNPTVKKDTARERLQKTYETLPYPCD